MSNDIEVTFNNVNERQYNRLLSYFKNGQQEYTKVSFDDKTKRRVNINTNEIMWKSKKILSSDPHEYYTINNVIEVDMKEPKNFESSFTREKLQNTFKIGKDHLLLSESLIKDQNNINNQYEIQLNTKAVDSNIIDELLRIMNDTDINYTNEDKLLLIKDVNKVLNLNEPLIPNIFKKAINATPAGKFILTAKSKGLRRMLIIHSTGVWLVNPPYDYNLIIKYDDLFKYFFYSWHVTIFDGDLITPINKTDYDFNYLHWFLCHDCIAFNNRDIRNNSYNDRIDKAKIFRSLIPIYVDEDFLKFSLQTIRVYEDNFNDIKNEIKLLRKILNYETNGYVITPLGEYQDVYQIRDEMTFDLAIYDTGIKNQIELYAYDDKRNKDVKLGSIITMDEDMILQESFENANMKRIGECHYDDIMNKLYLVKIRSDKTKADTVQMVLDNWKNMEDC